MNDIKEIIPLISESKDIKKLIHVIRGKHVMIDSDLAMLYQVETKVFNQTVKRNIERFPSNFMFQLNNEETNCLRSQFVTSNRRGGRRYNPYAFTEQGIAMLSGVLKSNVAVHISIKIMNTFIEMRKLIADNGALYDRVCDIEIKQLEYQKYANEKFNQVFRYIEEHTESEQKIFFDGQIYDAFSLIISIIKKANKEIILIDGYVDINTLNILSKKNNDVSVKIYTYKNTRLTSKDISIFNEQYPLLKVVKTQLFHDRFIILDKKIAYHIDASIKDAGKKCFGISIINDFRLIEELIRRLDSNM